MPSYYSRYGMESSEPDPFSELLIKRPAEIKLEPLIIPKLTLFSSQPNHGSLMVRTVEEIHVGTEYQAVEFGIPLRIRVTKAPYLKDGVLHIDVEFLDLEVQFSNRLSLADYGVVSKPDGTWEWLSHILKIPDQPKG